MTTGNLSIGFNDHDDATLSCSVVPPAGFEAENTQNTDRADVLRTADLTTFSVTGVVPETRTASSVFLFRHLLAGASVRWQFYTDAGATTPATGGDSGTVAALCYTASETFQFSTGTNDLNVTESAFWYHYAAPVTYRSYKLTVSGTPSAAAYFQIGRIAVCRMFQVAVNPDYGVRLGLKDLSRPYRTDGGTLRVARGEVYRTLTVDLSGVYEYERSIWVQIMRNAGTGRDVVASVFPGDGTTLERDYTMNGMFSSLDDIGRQVSRLTKRLQLEEV